MKLTKPAATAVKEYFASIKQNLQGVPADEQQEILRDLKFHIADALKARNAAEPVDVEVVRAVLAEMDPPQSYARASGPVSDSPAPPSAAATAAPPLPPLPGRTPPGLPKPGASQPWLVYGLVGGAVLLVLILTGAGAVYAFLRARAAAQSMPTRLVEADFAAREKGDLDALARLSHPDWQEATREAYRLGESGMKIKRAALDLANATEKAFGKPTAEALRRNLGPMSSAPSVKDLLRREIDQVYRDGKVDWSMVRISLEGDKGRVTWPGQLASAMRIVKVDGRWYELPDDAGRTTPENVLAKLRTMQAGLDETLTELKGITAKVRSGRLSLEQYRQASAAWGRKAIAMGLAWQGRDDGGRPPSAGPRSPVRPSPPKPPKPKVSDFKTALAALNSKDVFLRKDGLAWFKKNKPANAEQTRALCAAAAEGIDTDDVFGRRDMVGLLCDHAGKDQIPLLVKAADLNPNADVWRPALSTLFALSAEQGRKIVIRRATESDVRRHAMDLFRRDPTRYADQAALLFTETVNPDLRRDLIGLLRQIGDETAMDSLHEFRAKLGNNIEYVDEIRLVEQALQTIRQRLVDRGKQMPPEPKTDLAKLTFPDAEAAFRGMQSKNWQVKQAVLKWFEDIPLENPEHVKKLLEKANEIRKTAHWPEDEKYAALFARYASKEHVEDLVAMAKAKRNVAVPAVVALLRLAPDTGREMLLASATEAFFPGKVFDELQKDPANEAAVIKLLRDEPVEDLAIRALEAMGTIKCISPLLRHRTAVKARRAKDFHTKVRNDRKAKAIDKAVAAVRLRMAGRS